MNIREKIQNGAWRGILSILVPSFTAGAVFNSWPMDATAQVEMLGGLQKVAFVGGAFAVTAYNLRTRVIDLALKIEGDPRKVDDICSVASSCGTRLTNLVLLFTFTSIWLASLSLCKPDTITGLISAAVGLALLLLSCVQFIYVIFSFERLERFVLDQAVTTAKKKENDRISKRDVDKKTISE